MIICVLKMLYSKLRVFIECYQFIGKLVTQQCHLAEVFKCLFVLNPEVLFVLMYIRFHATDKILLQLNACLLTGY